MRVKATGAKEGEILVMAATQSSYDLKVSGTSGVHLQRRF